MRTSSSPFVRLFIFLIFLKREQQLIDARLVIQKPSNFFILDQCDVEFAPFTSRNFTEIWAKLKYFKGAVNGRCEDSEAVDQTFHRNESFKKQAERLNLQKVPNVWEQLWDASRHGLRTHTAHLQSHDFHTEIRDLQLDTYDVRTSSGRKTPMQKHHHSQRQMQQINKKDIWILDTCNTSISKILEEANQFASGLLFFDLDFMQLQHLPSYEEAQIPVGSLNSKASPLPEELQLVLLSPQFFNITSIEVKLDSELALSCHSMQPLLIASLLSIPLWCLLFCMWGVHLLKNLSENNHPLDRLILGIIGLKILILICNALNWSLCPEFQNTLFQYLLLCYFSLVTVFYSTFFTVLVLISKGFTLIKSQLNRNEALSALFLITLVYIVTCVNQLYPNISMPCSIFVYTTLFISMWKSTTYIIEFLDSRYQYMQLQQQLLRRRRSSSFSTTVPPPPHLAPLQPLTHHSTSGSSILFQTTPSLNTEQDSERLHGVVRSEELFVSSSNEPNHLENFENTVAFQLKIFLQLKYLFTFYFLNEIITIRIVLVLFLNNTTAAFIAQLSLELIVWSWLCYILHQRDPFRINNSVSQILLHQNGSLSRHPPKILDLYVASDDPPDTQEENDLKKCREKRILSFSRCGNPCSANASELTAVSSSRIVVVVNPNQTRELGIREVKQNDSNKNGDSMALICRKFKQLSSISLQSITNRFSTNQNQFFIRSTPRRQQESELVGHDNRSFP